MSKNKRGRMLRWRIRHGVSHAIMRDEQGTPIIILAYTARSAKHQAKAMLGCAVIVEQL